MGYYINPTDCTKEAWLQQNGTEIPPMTAKELVEADGEQMPVVLVDNGAFTAAGVAYSAGALMAFFGPHDHRPKRVYAVDREKLKPFCDIL